MKIINCNGVEQKVDDILLLGISGMLWSMASAETTPIRKKALFLVHDLICAIFGGGIILDAPAPTEKAKAMAGIDEDKVVCYKELPKELPKEVKDK